MNLSVISNQIAIDKFEIKNSEKFVHFFSRPDESLRLPRNWDSIVYMSKTTARGMMLKNSPVPMKFIRILEINKPVSITLPGGSVCTVTMFENSGLAESVAFHFKGDKGTALYSGSFTRCRALLLNNLLRRYVLNGIDFLYVDNTAVNSNDPVSLNTAASEILKIANSYPDHRILMNVPPFGYEDLIYSVVNLAKLKVFAVGLHLLVFQKYDISKLFESDIREARVIVAKQEVVTTETIYRRFTKEKLLTLRVIPCDSAPKNYFEKSGLFQVHWSPHPLLFEICCLLNYVKPKSVSGIYSSLNFPTFLRGIHQQMEANEQIENSAIKVKTTTNDLIKSISEDLQLDKSWSIFDSSPEHGRFPDCSQVKQSPEMTSQLAPKEKLVTIPSSRKRRKKYEKEYAKLPKRSKNQTEGDTLEESKFSLNGMVRESNILHSGAESDLLDNDKATQIKKSLSISTFTSLSLFTNNDQALDANEKETSKHSDKITPSVKSVSVSTFTSLSSCENSKIRKDEVPTTGNSVDDKILQKNEILLTASEGKSAKSQNKPEKRNLTRSRQDKQCKTELPKRSKTTFKKSRRDSGSKPQKESEEENTVSISVVCSLTISTFSSLESSFPSSIIPNKKRKISSPIRDSDSGSGHKSVAVNYKRELKHELQINSKTSVTSKVTTNNLNLDRLLRRKEFTSNHKASTKLRTKLKCKRLSKKELQEDILLNNKISGKKVRSRISKNQENICGSLDAARIPNSRKETAPKAKGAQNDPLVELVFSKHKKIADKKQNIENS